jgi:hypothetical protein
LLCQRCYAARLVAFCLGEDASVDEIRAGGNLELRIHRHHRPPCLQGVFSDIGCVDRIAGAFDDHVGSIDKLLQGVR